MKWAAVVLIGYALSAHISEARSGRKEVKFSGQVVAFDQTANLLNLTSAPQLQVLVVKVDDAKRKELPPYVKVVVSRFYGEPELHSTVFEPGNRLRFVVWSNPKMLEICRSALPHIRWLAPNKESDIPSMDSLKCFESRPQSLKEQR